MCRNIIFFDLETTGTNICKDRIVQISARKLDELFVPVSEPKKFIINPTIPIPKEASEVHGITDEMVKDKPTFQQYSKAMFEFFKDCILGGYNIKYFDIPLLSEEFARCGINFPNKDVEYVDSNKIFIKKEPRTLSAAVKFYTGKDMKNAHDADADNVATIEVLQGQMFMYGMETIQNVIDFCKEDDKDNVDFAGKIVLIDEVPCFSFGKYKGKPVKNHPDFVLWMLSGDFPLNTKIIAKQIAGIK